MDPSRPRGISTLTLNPRPQTLNPKPYTRPSTATRGNSTASRFSTPSRSEGLGFSGSSSPSAKPLLLREYPQSLFKRDQHNHPHSGLRRGLWPNSHHLSVTLIRRDPPMVLPTVGPVDYSLEGYSRNSFEIWCVVLVLPLALDGGLPPSRRVPSPEPSTPNPEPKPRSPNPLIQTPVPPPPSPP